MEIHFDPEFDSGAWPGALGDRDAAVGHAWVGYEGLLGVIETQLGLRGPRTSSVARVAALLPALRSIEGFWSQSAARDPLATARRLVLWRDQLSLAGWTGVATGPGSGPASRAKKGARAATGSGAGSDLLASLAAVTAELQPGLAERLRAATSRLAHAKGALDLERLRSFAAPSCLPRLWRLLLEGLAQAGTEVVFDPLPAAQPLPQAKKKPGTDLAASRSANFRPTGDGSLQLVRAQGVLQAADELAAWLETLAPEARRQTLIIGADAVLDRALRSHGLPTLGAASRRPENPLLQILPLSLSLAWTPADPQRALELLTLPETPVPGLLRFKLARALHQTPAVDSDAWRKVLREDLPALELEPEEKARSLERIVQLFHPVPAGGPATARPGGRLAGTAVRDRVRMLQSWAHGRAAHAPESDADRWGALQLQLSVFSSLLDASGLGDFSAPQLKSFVEEATSAVPADSPLPAQAGFTTVGAPGAVCGPAERIVWWNFERNGAPTPTRLPFGAEDLAVLAAQGVELPGASAEALEASRRWSRPLAMARESLLCVCPRLGEDGSELFPHPLFDEVLARIPPEVFGPSEQRLVRATPEAKRPLARSTASLWPLPLAVREWELGRGQLKPRDRESPSGAAALLGCSLQWVLHYAAGVKSGALGNLPGAEQLLGSTAHALLATVLLTEEPLSPEQAEAKTQALFDSEGPRLAAPLFQPGTDAQRAEVRRITGLAARELYRLIEAGGFEVESVEEAYATHALGAPLEGTPDLVLRRGDTRAVVDFKWSGLKYRKESLEAGAAQQLAMYSRLLADGPLPPNAFFILKSQRLLTTDPAAFPGGQVVSGLSPGETWDAFERGHQAAWKDLQAGKVTAAGIGVPEDAPETSGTVDGVMHLTAPCNFCDYSAVCGRAFGDGSDSSKGGSR